MLFRRPHAKPACASANSANPLPVIEKAAMRFRQVFGLPGFGFKARNLKFDRKASPPGLHPSLYRR